MTLADVLGARGSTPATGAAFTRYGGDTSCVALSRSVDEAPSLLLDAGTGLRNLPGLLGPGVPFRGVILLGHLHWDHTHGLPFCPAVDHPDAQVDLYLPAQGVDPADLLARALGPPHFPIGPDGLRGRWRLHTLDEGTHDLDGWHVVARDIPHKGGRTLGYRVVHDGRSVAYVSDHHPGALGPGPDGLGARHAALKELGDGVDLLLHDAQYTRDEYADRFDLGHSTIDYALAVGEELGVGQVGLFHHDPARTDAELDEIATGAAGMGGRVVGQGDRLTV